MSTFGKNQKMSSEYHYDAQKTDESTITLDQGRICNHCKRIPEILGEGVTTGSNPATESKMFSTPFVHHHYENCMIQVKNSVGAARSDSFTSNGII